jgi:GTP pyrophosphokinase
LHRLQEECERAIKPEVEEVLPQIKDSEQIINSAITKPRHVKSNSGIIVDGEAGCMVKFARCCNPLPGDHVIGFVTKGFGISIHKQDCPNVLQNRQNPENADRWKEAHWESAAEEAGMGNSIYEALLQIYVDDRIGMLADITTALADMRVSILHINVLNRNDGRCIINLKVGCRNIDHCHSIVSRLRTLQGVDNILRGFS